MCRVCAALSSSLLPLPFSPALAFRLRCALHTIVSPLLLHRHPLPPSKAPRPPSPGPRLALVCAGPYICAPSKRLTHPNLHPVSVPTRSQLFHKRGERPVTDHKTSSRLAPSQTTLPDLLQEPPLKFSPRSVTTLDEEDEEDDGWDRTLRPAALEPHPRSVTHSRESSIEKLSQPLPPVAGSNLTSPRIIHNHSQSRSAIGGVIERVVDPKSASYGHHRQTSIVHGIQHSRNGSHASSSSSPLSPQMIAAAGASLTSASSDRPDMHAVGRLDPDAPPGPRPGTALSGTTVNSSGGPHVPERTSSATDFTNPSLTQRKMERMHSKSRRDHAHHHSHSSRHHKDEQKTVGEYALHVLFTSVWPFPPCAGHSV